MYVYGHEAGGFKIIAQSMNYLEFWELQMQLRSITCRVLK